MRTSHGHRCSVHFERDARVVADIRGSGSVGKFGHALQFVKVGTQPKATPVNAGLHQGSDPRLDAGGAADRQGEVAEFEMQAIPMVETFGERIEFF